MPELVPLGALVREAEGPGGLADRAGLEHPLLAVDLTDAGPLAPDAVGRLAQQLHGLAAVVAGVTAPGDAGTWDHLVDLTVTADEIEGIERNVRTVPRASISLVLLLRGQPTRTLDEGLAAESAVYSTLQGGPEFAAWRARHVRSGTADDGTATVRAVRRDGVLHVTLTRPDVHNAFNTRMRDELHQALMVAVADPSLRVHLDGAGPSFCSGGDLDEFGDLPDPATAHVTRLDRSVGRLLGRLGPRVEATLHGACLGSGIELPAFAGRVVARTGSTFGLPELGLGLIPGAGGTVSLTRRAGRHAVARLVLSGTPVDATTAHAWGLVDELDTEATRPRG